MTYRYLSHIIEPDTPVYGNAPSVRVEALRSLARSDTANVISVTMTTHSGTHIDAPYHFFSNGRRIAQYPAGFWVFSRPAICRVKLFPGQLLTPEQITVRPDTGCDIILFQSGWSNRRMDASYVTENPGVHPDTAEYLRRRFRRLRAVGIDWLSVSSIKNRESGRKVHRVFLRQGGGGHPLLIIEDMNLSCRLSGLEEVIVAPLLIEGADGAPCTVIGKFT